MILLFFANQSTGGGTPVVVPDASSSGGFFYDIDAYASGHRKRMREEHKALEEAQALADKVDREIAVILKKQEADDAEKRDFARLSKIAKTFAEQSDAGFSNRIEKAIVRVNATQSAASLAKLQFEIERALREEEEAILYLLNNH